MSSTTILIIVLVGGFIAYLILRGSARRSRANYKPTLTYVDETLLDLVRTQQIRAATEYYQQHSGVSDKDAELIILYLVRRPEALLLLVRVLDGDHQPLYMDETLGGYLDQGRTLKAINYYCKQTGADIREAQTAVEALFVSPDLRAKRA